MSKIVLERHDDLIRANLAQVRHREDFVHRLIAALEGTSRPEPDRYRDYDDWYLSVLEDGLFRRVFVVEFREWSHRAEDLLRDQLSRSGTDSAWWDEIKDAAGEESFVSRVRRAFATGLSAEASPEIWGQLEEIGAVAETIGQGTREARTALRERYPHYFSELDAFGDGDVMARITLRLEHVERAFTALRAFWDPEEGLPYRLAEGAA